MTRPFQVLGSRMPRVAAFDKVTGRALFADDRERARMLSCAPQQNPLAHPRTPAPEPDQSGQGQQKGGSEDDASADAAGLSPRLRGRILPQPIANRVYSFDSSSPCVGRSTSSMIDMGAASPTRVRTFMMRV